MKKLTWKQLPEKIIKEIDEANRNYILDQYDNEVYHNQEVMNQILEDNGIELVGKEAKYCHFCGSVDNEVKDGVNGSLLITCNECNKEYNIYSE